MRRTGWLVAAYLATIGLGGTLVLQAGGAAVPAMAPAGGGMAAQTPAAAPAWEFIRLPSGALRPLLSAATLVLAGYTADLVSAVASVFPGMPTE